MIRTVIIELALFLLPFICYGIFLYATRATVFHLQSWPPRVVASLTVAALLLVLASLVVIAEYSGAPPGSTYEPAHMENGTFVPGRWR